MYLPTLQHVHAFITMLYACGDSDLASIVQSNQLGTHKHCNAYSHADIFPLLCILMACKEGR